MLRSNPLTCLNHPEPPPPFQAAQTFIPASVGQPAAAWRTARQLVAAGAVVGAVNSVAAAGVVLGLPWLFTNNAGVATAMAGLAKWLLVSLLIQLSSMCTEGMLLAGGHPLPPASRWQCGV